MEFFLLLLIFAVGFAVPSAIFAGLLWSSRLHWPHLALAVVAALPVPIPFFAFAYLDHVRGRRDVDETAFDTLMSLATFLAGTVIFLLGLLFAGLLMYRWGPRDLIRSGQIAK